VTDRRPAVQKRPAERDARAGSAIALGLVAAIGAAFLVRIVYLAQIRRLPFFEYPIIDGAEYLGWAHSILSGELLWRSVPIHGPVYPYFLALMLQISGKNFAFVVLAQFLLGAASVFFVHRIAARAFGRTAAAAAALIAATYVPFLYFEGLILPTVLIVVLDLAMLDRLMALPKAPRARALILPGLLLGLSIGVHPSALVLVPPIGAWLALRVRAGAPPPQASPPPPASIWKRFAPLAAFVGAALVVVVPIVARNASLGGGPVFQRNMGKNLYIGMGPGADGTANVPPGAAWERLRRQAWDAGARTPAGETRYFTGEAIGFAARNPARAIGLVAKKALLFVSGIHVDASQDFRFFKTHASVLRSLLPAPGVVIPLALLGLVLNWRRSPLLGVYLAGYLAASMLFAYATRYALPAHPVFIVFAAAALVDLARAARVRRVGTRETVLLGVFLLLANLDPFGLRKRQLLHTEGFIAKIAVETGDVETALRFYEQAARLYPSDPDIRNGWGTALDRLGRRDEARAQYEAALAADPELFEARFNLAAHAHEDRAYAGAVAGYRAAIEAAPWRADAHLNLGVAYAEMDSLDLAAAEFDTALAIAPDFREARVNLASVEMRRQNPQGAAAIYRQLIAETPTLELYVSLGNALTQAQDYLGAQEAFRAALRLDAANPAALFQLGMNLAGFQRFEEAIATWQRILDADPTNEVAPVAIAEAEARIAARDSAAAGAGASGGEGSAAGRSGAADSSLRGPKGESGAPAADAPPQPN
jgi:tetratricopeptide (TPR) repeat protein